MNKFTKQDLKQYFFNFSDILSDNKHYEIFINYEGEKAVIEIREL